MGKHDDDRLAVATGIFSTDFFKKERSRAYDGEKVRTQPTL